MEISKNSYTQVTKVQNGEEEGVSNVRTISVLL